MRRNSTASTVILKVSGHEAESEDIRKLTYEYISLSHSMKKRMSKRYLLSWMLAFIFFTTALLLYRATTFESSDNQQISSDASQRARQLSLTFETPSDMPVFRRDKKASIRTHMQRSSLSNILWMIVNLITIPYFQKNLRDKISEFGQAKHRKYFRRT